MKHHYGIMIMSFLVKSGSGNMERDSKKVGVMSFRKKIWYVFRHNFVMLLML